ncbi:small secreted protein [Streptomyces sp. WAC06614]|uniref:small secreted protein n=1 Tax=Streptomyces sp. WAC06614 TaxID=2487416 RepID=UPI000F795513|nr:small secreted protein [Streptomyces sp. WAC06614]RSS78901.1 small secreted protein [Streptomyces sp. WAC06614]
MNKKLAAAASCCAVLMLVLSGCGDDGDNKTDAWAKKVCDGWQPNLKKIEEANAEIKRVSTADTKSEDVQKTDSAAFQQISDAYKSLAQTLTQAGAPPVKNGEATQKAAADGFNSSAKAYAELKAKMDALDPKDQRKFADDLKPVAEGLKEAAKGAEEASEKLKSGGVSQAMNAQKGCQMTVPAPSKS